MHIIMNKVKPSDNIRPIASKNVESNDKRIQRMFDVASRLTWNCVEGSCRSLIIYGPAGLGKSYVVDKALEKSENHDILSGYVTKTFLFQMLYKNRHKGHVLVFDDCDSVLHDDNSIQLLKAACDSTDRRIVTYGTRHTIEPLGDELGPIPHSFEFNGTVIFITNTDFDKVKNKKISVHTQAMISRSHYIDLGLSSVDDYVTRIKQVVRQGLFSKYDLTKLQQDEVVMYIENNKRRLREISLRMALKLAQLLKDNGREWKDFADVTCLR